MSAVSLSEVLAPHIRVELRPRLPELLGMWRDVEDADALSALGWLHQRGHISPDEFRGVLQQLEAPIHIAPMGRAGTRSLGVLGKGAMGEVQVAHDAGLHRAVAIKRMHASVAADPTLRGRFLDEAQITAQLDHPGIIPVHGIQVGEDGSVAYAMKLIRGQTLADYLAFCRAELDAGRPLDEDHDLPARLEVFLQVCNAMAYAHTRGVIHRDLKPENVMIGSFHDVVVMDWGIAKALDRPDRSPTNFKGDEAHQTQVGIAIGTPAYMSPEQAAGLNNELSARSDQYTLGLILQEMVTLQRAVGGKTAMLTIFQAQMGKRRPIAPYSRREAVPRELVAVIGKATHRHPMGRYETVEAFGDDIRRFLRDEPVVAQPDNLLQFGLRWVGRHRAATLSALVVVVGLGMLGTSLAVGGGLVAVEMSRLEAAHREEQLSRLAAATTMQAARIDHSLMQHQGLLLALTASTEEALQRGTPEVRIYSVEDASKPETAPPDLGPSKIYGAASLLAPDVVFAPGVDRKAHHDVAQQLASVTPAFRRAMLRSAGVTPSTDGLDPASRRQILDKGVPMVWAYAGHSSGLMVGYPGTWEYPDDYDPRDRPWYRDAIAANGPSWSALDADESGMGLLLTCAAPLRDADGQVVGVAAVDLTFSYVIDQLLDPDGLGLEVEPFLVDGNGKVVVRASQRKTAMTTTTYAPEAFPWPDIQAQTRLSRSGWGEGADGNLVLWSRLEALDWTYVLVGRSEALLAR